MPTHRSGRSRYTPVTSSSEDSNGDQESSLGACKKAKASSAIHSASIKEAEELKLENKDGENGKFEKIRLRLPSDDDIIFDESDAEPKSDCDSEIDPLIEAENKNEGKGSDNFKTNGSPPLRSHGAYTAPTRGFDEESELKYHPCVLIEPSRNVENQDEGYGNGKFDKIRRPHQPTEEIDVGLRCALEIESEVESSHKSIHEALSKNEVDHDINSTVDATAGKDHEDETASQAAAHLDSLAPLNPPAEQDDARRDANIRGNIEKLRDWSDIMTLHGIVATFLFLQIIFFGIVYPHFSNTFWCERPMTTRLLNFSFLLFWWEVAPSVESIASSAIQEFGKSTNLLGIFHDFWELVFGSMSELILEEACRFEESLKRANGTTNVTAVAIVDSTIQDLLGAASGTANATVNACVNPAAQT
ncbi:82158c00-f939-4238-bdac-74e04fc16f18 [Sclerotinia trifoliorum]|uniref:82158c00-f939-4238-bdac-74e04fc16f18 n=1 Tax=Sclerotinia trifoliorum TaxID=28548 RepID=A0A8H2VZF8_9HELO|nr:82158c00-f939-4238-bdac-74e04fc16f18 [Sclerotinia trifoliorum]